jgi:hypothetical protein
MRNTIIAAALALAAGAAMADPVARAANGDSVRFTQAECPQEVAALVPQLELRERLRKAYAHIGGQDYVACWISAGNVRLMLFADGDQGMVPESDVHEEPGA